MGTLIIKYPNLKGFLISFYIFESVRNSFLYSAMSTIFLQYEYKFNLVFKLLPLNYSSIPENV